MARQGSLKLTALTRAYLDDLQVRGDKPKTIQGCAAKLGRFTRWAATTGATQLCHCDADRVKRYVAYLQQERRWASHPNARVSPQPLISSVAIRNYVRDLKTFAAWLAQEQYTTANVLAEVRKPKADETPIAPFSDDELQRLFSVDGYPLTTGTVEHLCTRLSRRVGFRVHPHRFRHTFAVGMLRNGTDIRTLQKLMGHASVQILVRYQNLANQEAIEMHRVNSPAGKHHALKQQGVRRLPMRRRGARDISA